MHLLLGALILSLLFIVSAMLFQYYRRQERKRVLAGLELTPNCLLTRYPIVFLAGRKSPFRPFCHWNDIPSYLREHGYDVWELDASHGDAPAEILLKSIESIPAAKCHLISDSASLAHLESIARMKHSKISSLTCVRNKHTSSFSAVPAPLSPSELKPLEHAIEYFELADTSYFPRGWRALFAALCLHIHNLVFTERSRQVDPLETAEFETSFSLASRFLDLAVSLAERDLTTGTPATGKEYAP